MAIQGINQYSQYSSSYRNNSLKETDTSAVEETAAQSGASADISDSNNGAQDNAADTLTEVNKAPKSSNPSDFLLAFKKSNNYNLVAATNDKEDINVNKALDEMKQDFVLEQYKFFVSEANLGTDQDGTVRFVQK